MYASLEDALFSEHRLQMSVVINNPEFAVFGILDLNVFTRRSKPALVFSAEEYSILLSILSYYYMYVYRPLYVYIIKVKWSILSTPVISESPICRKTIFHL